MRSYPPFNPDARCPKCAYDAVTTEYEGMVDDGPRLENWLDRMAWWPPHPARLIRTCARCSFAWCERPIDEEVGS